MSPADGGAPASLPTAPRTTTRLTLHLGVVEQPYRAYSSSGKGKTLAVTTYDVAQILERKYGVMQAYYTAHANEIAHWVEDSLAGALESLAMGGKVDPWGSATQKIAGGFRQFISSMEAERVGIPGTPTRAAVRGVNHRFKRPYSRKNPRRPSFRDTGLYMASVRSWID